MDDFEHDPSWRDFRKHVLGEMLPMLTESAISVSLCPDGEGDVKYWVELGASIMLDKPIIVLASPGTSIPERLRRVADEVVLADVSTLAGQKAIAEAIGVTIARIESDDAR